MDPRELYGASSFHHQHAAMLADEVARLTHAALSSTMVSALPAEVTEASPDGHSVTLRSTVKKTVLDPVTGQKTYEDYPVAPDVPIHYPGGNGTVLTHGLAVGDEVSKLFFSRNIDGWRQQGGSQQPFDQVIQHLGDSVAIPGIRSDPRKLQQVASDAMHARDEAKHAVHETKPGVGIRSFHADPSTAPASADFDPLSQAEKFVDHLSQSGVGAVGRAVDGSTAHDHGSHHGVGSWVQSFSGKHKVLASMVGALLSAFDGDHQVNADASGIQVTSKKAVAISAPPGMLSLAGLAAGSVGGATLGAGAAAQNVGDLGGDLSGTLPSPEVVGLHVDFSKLPTAANDAAAAAAGVEIGSLYRSTAFVAAGSVSSSGGSGGSSSTTLPASGLSVLVVRMI